MVTSLLKVNNLVKIYQRRPVVDGLSFEIYPGEIVGLLGHNGAGKTTAFYMTVGLIAPDQGEILFCSKDVTSSPVHIRAQMGMGYLAQEPSIFRNLTVEQNLMVILETLKLSKREKKELLAHHLEELGLTKLAKKKTSLLSGGEKRRVEIARALINNPKLLLLDEPFANIDPMTISDLKKLILLLKQKGISIFITDHNAREVFSIVDRCYLVKGGHVIASGNTEELIKDQRARESYLGEEFVL